MHTSLHLDITHSETESKKEREWGEREKREETVCFVFITGVAKAFDLPTTAHPDLVQLLKDYFGPDNLDSAKMKMAQVGC